MTTVITKSAVVFGLLLFMLIGALQWGGSILPHHILAYTSQHGIGLADTDHGLSGLLVHMDNIAAPNRSMRWSPDGKQLAFVSFGGYHTPDGYNDTPNYEINNLSLGSNEIRNISNSPLINESWPEWSPDGQMLAFSAQYMTSDGAKSEIRVVDTQNWQIIPYLVQASGYDYNPFWSPDGKWLAFLSRRGGSAGIYLADSSNGVLKNIVNNIFSGQFPVWSPDSKKIAFIRLYGQGGREIYVTEVESQTEFGLAQDTSSSQWGSNWSPDGKQILFVSDRDDKTEFYLIDVANGVTKRLNLLTSKNYDYSLPAKWSPDGRWLAISLTTTEGTNIYTYDSSADSLYRVASDGYDFSPVWRP